MNHLKTTQEFDEVIQKDHVIIDFYAEWCGPCKMMEEVWKEFLEQNPDYTVIAVDVDRFGSIARKYHVMSIPNIKIFSNGEVVSEQQGFMTIEELSSFVKK